MNQNLVRFEGHRLYPSLLLLPLQDTSQSCRQPGAPPNCPTRPARPSSQRALVRRAPPCPLLSFLPADVSVHRFDDFA
ncbi:hypothetical protein DSO57_1009209 [Entomophthora muscae]|uniref:Uncharacterized protein n=1 Tax=Entomophthora muscae TaxID=34485 RepID=A0ACC2SVP5_9FUNG|nr:hypothetical protein DSO57_1009209 [Entomophthora muscae]